MTQIPKKYQPTAIHALSQDAKLYRVDGAHALECNNDGCHIQDTGISTDMWIIEPSPSFHIFSTTQRFNICIQRRIKFTERPHVVRHQ